MPAATGGPHDRPGGVHRPLRRHRRFPSTRPAPIQDRRDADSRRTRSPYASAGSSDTPSGRGGTSSGSPPCWGFSGIRLFHNTNTWWSGPEQFRGKTACHPRFPLTPTLFHQGRGSTHLSGESQPLAPSHHRGSGGRVQSDTGNARQSRWWRESDLVRKEDIKQAGSPGRPSLYESLTGVGLGASGMGNST